ncbi:MAG: hypothetical protein P8Y03_00790 [Anaerolineales bacterium]
MTTVQVRYIVLDVDAAIEFYTHGNLVELFETTIPEARLGSHSG